MFGFARKSIEMPTRDTALPGRPNPLPTAETHVVNGAALKGPYPAGAEVATFGLGCFWGAERAFWKAPGVLVTAVGYTGGLTPNPTYEEVCTGRTGHNEVVRVVFDPSQISYEALLKMFFEIHDPTQGMRQGNDLGTQYRSGVYVADARQREAAEDAKRRYDEAFAARGMGPTTTEILDAPEFFYAEGYHQQYLAKEPNGYCNLGGVGVSCPLPTGVAA